MADDTGSFDLIHGMKGNHKGCPYGGMRRLTMRKGAARRSALMVE